MQLRSMRGLMVLLAVFAAGSVGASEAAGEQGGHGAAGVDWQNWKAGNDVGSSASLQRGAANFVNYCIGCHSLKFMRYERMAKDLGIGKEQLEASLIATGAKPADYMLSTFPKADAEVWFGKMPPDLSLVSRSRGVDWLFQFLKGFYVDTSKPTGTNNLVLDGASMPAVLSDLEGVKAAVFVEHAAGSSHAGKSVERFDYVSHGSLKPEEFDAFVRDTVNFLDYVGEPAQQARRSIGVWVVLFLGLFTFFAYLLKKDYWKDVH